MLIFSPTFLGAQNPEGKLEVWQMSDDLDSLYHQILEAHPDPYFFSSPLILQKAFYNTCDQLNKPLTPFEFAGVLNQLTKVLEDSHTGVDYLQFSSMAFERNHRIVPINVYSDSDNRLLVKSAWDSTITPGWQLRCINGQDCMEPYSLAYQQYSYTEADALQGKKRITDALWPLIAANAWALDSLNEVELEHPISGEIKIIQSRGYESKDYHAIRKARAKKGAYEPFNFEINGEKDYAYMRVGTFAPTSRDQYKKRIKQAFKEIQNSGVHHLILDISGNGGGSSNNVEYLYSFIDSTGYNTPMNVIGINSPLSRDRAKLAANPVFRWIMRHFMGHNEDVRGFLKIADLPNGERDTAYFSDAVIQKKYVFKGEVSLLINGMTASAGVDFTNAFQQRGRGCIIGESCMGPKTGTFGNPAMYQLPNSGIRFYVATIRYNYDNSFMPIRQSIEPDEYVVLDWYDLENAINPSLEKAKSLIPQK